MSKVVFVGWPHLMEAKIVRISDRESTYFTDGNSDKTDPHKWKVDVQVRNMLHKTKNHQNNRGLLAKRFK